MRAHRPTPFTHWFARGLIVVGAIMLARVGVDLVRARAYQREHFRAVHSGATPEAAPVRSTRPAPALGEVIGWLEIPRVGLSGAVVHGDGDDLLKTAIGHLPDTPFPWNAGNSAVAAHRDTFFGPLRHVRPDDLLRFKTSHGEFEYRVRDTLIVDPEDLWVLNPTPAAMLTLITCYPFNYIGSAPRRFIVRAERIDTSHSRAGTQEGEQVGARPPFRWSESITNRGDRSGP